MHTISEYWHTFHGLNTYVVKFEGIVMLQRWYIKNDVFDVIEPRGTAEIMLHGYTPTAWNTINNCEWRVVITCLLL